MTQRQLSLDGTAWLMLVGLSLVWGGSFFFVEVALAVLPPFTIVMARMTIGAFCLWAIVLALRPAMPKDRRTWRDLLVMGVLNNTLPFCLIVAGQVWISGGLASVFNATTPLFGVIAAHYVTRDERLTANRLAGVLIGLAGVVVLIGPAVLGDIGEQALGSAMVLLAAMSYATAGLWGRRLRHLPPLSAATGQASCSAAILIPLALAFDHPWDLAMPPLEVWAALAGLGFFSTAVAYLLFFAVLRRAGGSNAMLVTLMVPPSAILLGVLVLGEPVSAEQLAGMVLVGLGLVAIDGRAVARLKRLYRP
ncbi:MAG: DMT family transporter [Proteobacteria bacterium]|nr:DMT family transporter [Pseudomonadota bacterium]MDA0952715.1 DMT family transporter [Pseudomonadota bacterium]MDA1070751.1 DMT family transporter [Pseudomonadota bacterium]